MKLFQRIFFAAVLAGLAAGLVMSAVQQWRLVPLILEAETYETAAPAAPAVESPAPAEHEANQSHDEGWAPQDGTERTLYTLLANLLGAVGFMMLLSGVSAVSNIPITARNGLIWGLAGFVALQLAPDMGLSPNLPGIPVFDTPTRQLWWLATAVSTGAGLLAIARLRNGLGIAIAVVLLLAPHIIGAPAAPSEPSSVPARLASAFAARSIATGALFWLIAGPLLGWLNERFAKSPAFALKGAHA